MTVQSWRGGLIGAAMAVAVVTVVARVVGFGRWFVFSKTVGDTCLGDAYNTANQLPNVAFEMVAGGALVSVVVPVLAMSLGKDDHDRTASALFTWTLLVLTPVVLLAAVLAQPYARLMLGEQADCPGATDALAGRMLLVFVPQVWCYGLAVVATGVLQARRRFLAAALAPLVSSVVVIAAYLGFGILAAGRLGVDEVSGTAVAVLAGGTTLGVLALASTVLLPLLRRGGLAFRPTLRFPAGVGPRVRALALAGLAALFAQQAVALAITWLANHRAAEGGLTLYTWAFALFMLPYAVLAVPIATTVFPHLSAVVVGAPDGPEFVRVAAMSLRSVVLAGLLGSALLAGTAVPVARVFVLGPGAGDTAALANALVAFAVGVPAFGVVTLAGRLLYARHRGGLAAAGTSFGWLMVAVAAVVLTDGTVLPAAAVPAGLGAAVSIGLVLGALVLLGAVARSCGRTVLTGLTRAAVAGMVAAAVAGAGGGWLGGRFEQSGLGTAFVGTLGCGLFVVLSFGIVVAVLDRADTRAVVERLRTMLRKALRKVG